MVRENRCSQCGSKMLKVIFHLIRRKITRILHKTPFIKRLKFIKLKWLCDIGRKRCPRCDISLWHDLY
jgi:hypothetical protein